VKTLLLFLILLVGGGCLSACNCAKFCATDSVIKSSQQPVMAEHPVLTEQEKLLPCFECHKDVTPDIYDEWYNSSHGIGSVKCYQCHGTYEELTKVPAMDRCGACHAAEVSHSEQATPCWNCHLSHTFTGH